MKKQPILIYSLKYAFLICITFLLINGCEFFKGKSNLQAVEISVEFNQNTSEKEAKKFIDYFKKNKELAFKIIPKNDSVSTSPKKPELKIDPCCEKCNCEFRALAIIPKNGGNPKDLYILFKHLPKDIEKIINSIQINFKLD